MNSTVIIIPEQHLWHKNIATIPNMVEDNQKIIDCLTDIVEKQENPIVIFDGDIFHREIKMTENAMPLLSFFIKLHSITNGQVYSVIGNHELTYKKNNLFWGLADVDSKYYQNTVKEPLIKVVDDLLIGDTLFIFGHYGVSLTNYNTSKDYAHAVLISHNEVVNSELLEALKARNEEFNTTFINGSIETFIPKISNLDYAFIGHMHQAHGKFRLKENGVDCIIHYLASLGRTNHTEYTKDLTREIPIIKIRDNVLTDVDYEEIILTERYISVNEERVALNKEAYERDKEIRTLRTTTSYSDDCVKGLKEIFNLNPQACNLIDCALKGELPEEVIKLKREYQV